MAVRGHNLAWPADNPTWLTSVPYSRDQLIGILHEHIQTVVGHFRGKVAQWDVVNEGIGGFWWDHIGPEYIDMAFRWAHEADPAAKLFYNDFGAEGLGGKSDQVYALVRGLKQRGVPIDGVGLESHFDLNPPSLRDVGANMHRLKQDGVPILGFTWYSLTDQIDWGIALAQANGAIDLSGAVQSTIFAARSTWQSNHMQLWRRGECRRGRPYC